MTNRIQGTTRLVGLLGKPIRHSRSPHMHNSAFEFLKEDLVYLCFEIENKDLEMALNALKTFDAVGANITYPNKQEVLKYLDEIDEAAEIIGSVNTISIDDKTKKIKGYNTDGLGFIESLEKSGIQYKGKKMVLIGVGGAGRAIAIQSAYSGVGELVIKELNKEVADEVINTIKSRIPKCNVKLLSNNEDELKEELKNADLFVNATPLGMKGNIDACSISSCDIITNPNTFVYDIVYEPKETKFMKFAKEAGCKTCNGINMMLWQGALAFKIWTGKDMPIDYVKKELGLE
ncbi:shikimate dehydrogenase [Peptoniphilus sp. SGI.035]|uniref:shikimate dehydrogenase n=1 Tax=unclassified Peptoniphilus TaxID=2637196 RepID=UPI002A7EE01B|nr:shikimate dehydrogenase [Peptoniphilus sp.]MDY3903064.1 shikimate dehydrogenase [Peptoniphilus sp.]